MSTPKKSAQAPKTKASTPAAAGSGAEALRVVPKRAGFRRAGYEFPEEGRTIPLSQLTTEQLQQLENEPMLVTSRVGTASTPEDQAPAAEASAAETPAA